MTSCISFLYDGIVPIVALFRGRFVNKATKTLPRTKHIRSLQPPLLIQC